MERVTFGGKGGHLGGGDLDALGIAVRVDLAADGQARLVVVAPISWTMTWWLTSGLPRQFCEM